MDFLCCCLNLPLQTRLSFQCRMVGMYHLTVSPSCSGPILTQPDRLSSFRWAHLLFAAMHWAKSYLHDSSGYLGRFEMLLFFPHYILMSNIDHFNSRLRPLPHSRRRHDPRHSFRSIITCALSRGLGKATTREKRQHVTTSN